jgi:hypothetical protein
MRIPSTQALVLLKILPSIPPLQKSNNGVEHGQTYANHFESRLPPLKGLIPLVLGFVCLYYGWIPPEGKPCNGRQFLVVHLGAALAWRTIVGDKSSVKSGLILRILVTGILRPHRFGPVRLGRFAFWHTPNEPRRTRAARAV